MTYQTTLIPGSGYGNTFIDSLIYGDRWVGSVITYSFNSGATYGAQYGYISGDNWLPSERSAVASVFSSYSAVCNLTFQNVTDNSSSSNLAFWSLSSWYMGLNQGAFDTPNGVYSQLYGYFNYSDPGWFYLQPGGQGYEVLVHEIGHALGLAHPHDGGGEIDRTIFPGVTSAFSTGTYDLNQRIWTVMSYNEGWNQRPSYTDAYGDVSTPMAFDIAALQAIYGANYSYNTGNNTYTLDSMNIQGTDWSCIWDAGGTDTISNASSSIACIINLNEAPLVGVNAGGYVSTVNGICGGFTIAHNVTIENAIGGSGSDIIIGNTADNNLTGGFGDDNIEGGLGNDFIDGGSGTDYVWYSFARSNYTITYLSGVYTIVALTGGEGQDQVIDVEYFQFSDQAVSVSDLDFIAPSVTTFSPLDAATGVAIGSNITITFSEAIQRGTGDIVLKDAANNVIATYNAATSTNLSISGSTLTINPSSDLSYSTQYYVTFAAGTIKDLAGNSYTGTSTYDFTTSALVGQTLTGTSAVNTLTGGAGNDIITGLGGTDILNGGEGSDLYVMTLTADHTAAEINDTGLSGTDEVRFTSTTASTLTLYAGDRGIEKIVIGTGTAASAVTTGTTANSINAATLPNGISMLGNSGANMLTGTAFSDTLDGGAGVDKLLGGAGNDIYIVDLLTTCLIQDTVTESSKLISEIDTIQLRGSYTLASATTVASAITLGANIENLNASHVGTSTGLLNLVGNTLANNITGSSGKDVITGAGGTDTLSGGDGNDLFVVALATDHTSTEIINGGNGTDEIRFTSTTVSTLTLSSNITNVEYISIGTGTAASPVATGTAALNINASSVTYGLAISGNAGVNVLTGTGYDDILGGNGGNDTLTGDNGNDTLWGGLGNDTLIGGVGIDWFVFDTVPNATSNKDTITDFISGTDVIWFENAIMTAFIIPVSTTSRMLTSDEFWSGAGVTTAHDATDRIIYNTTTGALYYDADGSGSTAAIQIALMGTTTHPLLLYTDFAIF